jgi:Tfp pilus assembly protein FimT
MEVSLVPALIHVRSARRQRGKSLVELSVSLALGALMLALTATSVLALALGEQSGTAASELSVSIESARAEAALRRVPVGVCGIRASEIETPAADLRCTAHSWTGGWMTFVDGNNNQQMDRGEIVLQVRRTRRVQVELANAATSHAVGFRPTGTLAHSLPMLLTVQAANAADPNARAVCVGIDGHVQIVGAHAPCR